MKSICQFSMVCKIFFFRYSIRYSISFYDMFDHSYVHIILKHNNIIIQNDH